MKKPLTLVIGLIGAALLAWLLFGFFGIQALFMDNVVNEAVPSIPSTAITATSTDSPTDQANTTPSAIQLIAQGDFTQGDSTYSIQGQARITEQDGVRTLSLTNFDVTNGPDLFVYIVQAESAENANVKNAVAQNQFISIAELKGNKGNQTYTLPADLALTDRSIVSIWCKRFSRNFGAASLQNITSPVSRVIQDLQAQSVPETNKLSERTPTAPPTSAKITLYKGRWFDISYPETFSAKPTGPTITTNNITHIKTDEASFTSPDASVEFFIYSPFRTGNPETYLTIAPNETLVDEKVEEKLGAESTVTTRTRWVTVKAQDNSYFRSFVSITGLIDSGSEVHHVFGIKYRDVASYEQYKESYNAFKTSLRQYAD